MKTSAGLKSKSTKKRIPPELTVSHKPAILKSTQFILDKMGIGVLLLDDREKTVFINQAFYDIFGFSRNIREYQSVSPLYELHPLGQIFASFKKDPDDQYIEAVPVKTKTGRIVHVSGFIRHITKGKKHMGTICAFMNISSLIDNKIYQSDYTLQMEMDIAKRTSNLSRTNEMLRNEIRKQLEHEQELMQALQRFESIFQETMKGLGRFTPDGVLVEANKALAVMLGYESAQDLKEAVNRQNMRIFLDEQDWNRISRQLVSEDKIIRTEMQISSFNRALFWAEISGLSVKTKRDQLLFEIIFSDISHQKIMETDLYRKATHDSLTGVPNRILWNDRLEQAVKMSRRYTEGFAVLFMDLDGFKSVNDKYGHKCGDLVLIEVVKRILSKIRESDTLARLGGDEFCLLMNNPGSKDDMTMLAQNIIDCMKEKIAINKHCVQVGISIGIFMSKDEQTDPDEIMSLADNAMYMAKKKGGNTYTFV
ncbi:diguanylate cyclase domain-containing protein [Desulfonatronovibrio magnus]|uniref:diguanylate cyclase domain-containing protein n=1 Tax=Desulfonatronovibrio magnus TaxID=698827 RepID=UPI0005EBBFA3|nr:diguanylate cyclase [Desulfonatronovibrio magnus]